MWNQEYNFFFCDKNVHANLSFYKRNWGQDEFSKVTIIENSIGYFPINIHISSHLYHISSLHHNPIQFMKSSFYVKDILGPNNSKEKIWIDTLDQIIKGEDTDLLQPILPFLDPKEGTLKEDVSECSNPSNILRGISFDHSLIENLGIHSTEVCSNSQQIYYDYGGLVSM